MQNLLPAEYVDPASGLTISAVYIHNGAHASIMLANQATKEIIQQPCPNLAAALTISEIAERLINQ